LFSQDEALLPFVLEFVVGVGGEIRRPGLYPVAEETSLADIISYAGGITSAADRTGVEIDRASTGVAGERKVFPAVGEGVANVMVSAGSIVRFLPSLNPREFGAVAIGGEVVRPGRYEIRKGDKLSDLLQRVGGLTPFAYPYGAVFVRESVRQAEQVGFDRAAREIQAGLARAAQDLDANELAAVQQVIGQLRSTPAMGRVVVEADPTVLRVRPELDVLLEPGDRIVYPKRPPYIVVSGAVLNPTALQFEAGQDVRHYLDQAGGFQRFADRRRTFIVFPNGAASRADLGVFEYSVQRPPPGTTIVVPPDPVPLNYLRLATNVSTIFSQLAIAAASLAVIQN
jgi:protein involved in polysaccharide export with SLBB domain